MSQELDIAEALSRYVDARLEDVHTCLPGIVTAYEGHKTRLATVQPTVRLASPSGVIQDIPPIKKVPVVFPSTALGTLYFPIRPGDGVTIVFSEAAIGKYLKSSGTDLVDPGTLERHSLTDAIAIPGLWAKKAVPPPPTDIADDAVAIVSENGSLVELSDVVGIRNQVTDLRTELEKLYDFLRDQVIGKHTADFTALAAAVLNDAGFMINTNAAFLAQSVADPTVTEQLTAMKAKLGELLK